MKTFIASLVALPLFAVAGLPLILKHRKSTTLRKIKDAYKECFALGLEIAKKDKK
jgi:hypothetical protein